MQPIPNIARERLKAQNSDGNHVDANLLCAFAEKSLSERERVTVLDHLSCCAECRDIVVLALPATEEMQPAAKPSPSRWLTWPGLRWGLVTAGIAIIAAFGVMNYQRNAERSAQLAPPTSQGEQVKLAAKAEPTHLNFEPSAGKAEKSAAKTVSPESPSTLDKNPQPSPKLKQQEHQMVARGLFTQSAPTQSAPQSKRSNAQVNPPSVSEPGQTPSQSAQMQAAAPAPPVPTELAQADQSAAAARSDDSDARIGKAKLPVSAQVEVSGAAPLVSVDGVTKTKKDLPTNGLNASEMVEVAPAIAPRWNISSTGTLQRSFDQGATWEDVDVTAYASTGAVIAGPLKAPAPAEAMKLSKPSARAAFRAVAANGPDVWAGGSAGLLYHSVDGGNHWTRVLPSGDGAVLTGDIVSVVFPDAQHGRITTSVPEVWNTPDAGGTWQKQ
jgi:hypothetical protein